MSGDNSISTIARSIHSRQLRSLLQSVESTTLFCQETIAKTGDARLNYSPSEAAPRLTDSSQVASGGVDWRSAATELPHQIIETPAEIESLCARYLNAMGSKWGAFDFGILPDGGWGFFECNPNGQWLWIELLTKYPISDLIAESLLAHHRASHQTTASIYRQN